MDVKNKINQADTSLFDSLVSQTPKDRKILFDYSFFVSKQIVHILEKKKWSQRQLADEMGKNETEVSRWLSGTHNFTLATIAKIQAALGEEIIVTPIEYETKINRQRVFSQIAHYSRSLATSGVIWDKQEIFVDSFVQAKISAIDDAPSREYRNTGS